MLIQIDSGYFCTGVVLQNDRVIRAAPIVKYMIGWTSAAVFKYTASKGWSSAPIEQKSSEWLHYLALCQRSDPEHLLGAGILDFEPQSTETQGEVDDKGSRRWISFGAYWK